MKIAIYDADSIAYIISWTCREFITDETKVKFAIDKYLDNVFSISECTHFVGFVKDKSTSNFRKKDILFNKYKHNREQSLEYSIVQPIVEKHLIETWRFYSVSLPIEVDDIVNIYVNNLYLLSSMNTDSIDTTLIDYVIIHYDKDLNQIPGKHLVWSTTDKIWKSFECDKFGFLVDDSYYTMKTSVNKKGQFEAKSVKKTKINGAGLMWLAYQMLVGDTVDCVKGVKDVGSVKAYNLLKNVTNSREVYTVVKSKYEEVYSNIDTINKTFKVNLFTSQYDLFIQIEPLFVNTNIPKQLANLIFKESFKLLKLLDNHKDFNIFNYKPIKLGNE